MNWKYIFLILLLTPHYSLLTPLFAGYYYGDNYRLDSCNYTTLDSLSRRISFRFTARASLRATQLRFYVNSRVGLPTYTISLRLDNNGLPGSVLSSTTTTVNVTEWFIADIPDVPLDRGTTYHFVIEPVSVDSSNYIEVTTNWTPYNLQCPVDLSTDTAQNFLYDTNNIWENTDIQNRTPVYVVDYAGIPPRFQGVPYFRSAFGRADGKGTPNDPTDDEIYAERFTVTTASFVVTKIAYYMYKVGNPGSDPIYCIVDVTPLPPVILSSGTLASEASVTGSPAWIERPLPEPVTFSYGRTYRVELRCTTGNPPSPPLWGNFYTFAVPFTDGVAPYSDLTYDTTNSYAQSLTNGGGSWDSELGRDAPFRLWVPIPPAQITDLKAQQGANESEVKLTWTATGDDGTKGTAQQYFVKYATFQINTMSDWDSPSAISYTGQLPAPTPSGTQQQAVLTGLPKGWFFFNIRARDDNTPDTPPHLCISPPSNSPHAEVKEISPKIITNLVGSPLPGGTSVQLNWTAPGDDYTTGTADKYTIKYSTWIYDNNTYVYRTVPFYWYDGITGSTGVAVGDKVFTNVQLPFPFIFYGITYSTIDICSDGYISFYYPGVPNDKPWDNVPIPDSSKNYPNGFIAALWDDLENDAKSSGIYYKADMDKVIVTYDSVYKYKFPDSRQTFQIVLYQDNSIRINYKSLTGNVTSSCTVGVENQTGSIGVEYHYDNTGGPLYNELSIEFFNGIDMQEATLWKDARPVSGPFGTSESEAVENLSPDTTYYFVIDTRDERPNPSRRSNTPAIKTIDIQPPAAVTTLSGMPGFSEGNIELNWVCPGDNGWVGNLNMYEWQYKVKFTTVATDTWETIPEGNSRIMLGTWTASPFSTVLYTLTGLTNGVTYYIRVKTADEVPLWSDVSNVTTSYAQIDIQPPGQVSDFAAVTGEQIKLTWTSPGDNGWSGDIVNGKYEVRYTSNPNKSYSDFPDPEVYQLEWSTNTSPNLPQVKILTGLQPRVTYYFWIRTADEVPNWSVWSNTVSAVSGSFVVHQEPAGINGPAYGGVAWGDFDNDGDLDLTVNGYDGSGYKFQVYRNDNGNFVLHQEPAGINGPANGGVAWG
ncbi:MAG: hypothetical protein QME68_03650, partial [Elusimicrobiota bacterium]|nr:hypothetical protein [Elusimicrobiota bacterium]